MEIVPIYDSMYECTYDYTRRHSMQPDEDLNRSKPVVAIGLSRVISLLLVFI